MTVIGGPRTQPQGNQAAGSGSWVARGRGASGGFWVASLGSWLWQATRVSLRTPAGWRPGRPGAPRGRTAARRRPTGSLDAVPRALGPLARAGHLLQGSGTGGRGPIKLGWPLLPVFVFGCPQRQPPRPHSPLYGLGQYPAPRGSVHPPFGRGVNASAPSQVLPLLGLRPVPQSPPGTWGSGRLRELRVKLSC